MYQHLRLTTRHGFNSLFNYIQRIIKWWTIQTFPYTHDIKLLFWMIFPEKVFKTSTSYNKHFRKMNKFSTNEFFSLNYIWVILLIPHTSKNKIVKRIRLWLFWIYKKKFFDRLLFYGKSNMYVRKEYKNQ